MDQSHNTQIYWRLILGQAALPSLSLSEQEHQCEQLVAWLYAQHTKINDADIKIIAPLHLTLPEWQARIEQYFPEPTCRRLNKRAKQLHPPPPSPEPLSRLQRLEQLAMPINWSAIAPPKPIAPLVEEAIVIPELFLKIQIHPKILKTFKFLLKRPKESQALIIEKEAPSLLKSWWLKLIGFFVPTLPPVQPLSPEQAFIAAAEATLKQYNLYPGHTPRVLRLNMKYEDNIPYSLLLHSLLILGIPGFSLQHPTSLAFPQENWKISTEKGFHDGLRAAAALGADLLQAAAIQLQLFLNDTSANFKENGITIDDEKGEIPFVISTRHWEQTPQQAFFHYLEQIQAKHINIIENLHILKYALSLYPSASADTLFKNFMNVLSQESEPLVVYEIAQKILNFKASTSLFPLITACYDKLLVQMQTINIMDDVLIQILTGFYVLKQSPHAQAFEKINTPLLYDILKSCITDSAHNPILRGTALGTLWSFQPESAYKHTETVIEQLWPTADLLPFLEQLFLFTQDHFSSIWEILDQRLKRTSPTEFMMVFPNLYAAFVFFPPYERKRLAQKIPIQQPPPRSPIITAQEHARGQRLETRLDHYSKMFGLLDA